MVSAFSKQSGAIKRDVLQASVFAWFLVQTKSGELTPFNIRHTVKAMAEPPGDNIQEQLCQLVETVKEDYGRVDLSAMWRPYCRYIDILMIGLAGGPFAVFCVVVSRCYTGSGAWSIVQLVVACCVGIVGH